jgi:P27 family predicted phage terminase small subunit
MKRGVKPKPAELQTVLGNPGRRPLKPQKKGIGEIGPPPPDLSPLAKSKWVEAADAWKVFLRRSDRDALRIYCEVWAELIEAQKKVKESGAMVLTPNGMVQKSPWLSKVEQSREFIRKMLAEFGASPSARNGVSENASDEESPEDRYFN